MLILGLDPGFAITGYGLVDSVANRLSMVKYGAITTPAGMPFTQRLLAIRN
ncbi:MAG: crossover junction endodeoxyribonuclease RuvC, partial [Clostridia bacterium]|nr:crossover junction endodeoxyribonuclease RuvC [Clostridia bacterium]